MRNKKWSKYYARKEKACKIMIKKEVVIQTNFLGQVYALGFCQAEPFKILIISLCFK